jgi:SAM-dependent methyltransferase
MGVSLRRRALHTVNRLLLPVNLHIDRARPVTWDKFFKDWIRTAKQRGIDPNDLGDDVWGASDHLSEALEEQYLSLVDPSSVVLELGPGSGRLTRHLVGRCQRVIAVDPSPLVRRWLRSYLKGQPNFTVHNGGGVSLAMIGGDEVDVVVAHGVFEHIDQEDMLSLFLEFHRVLRPGGTVAFNFDNLLGDQARSLMLSSRDNHGLDRFRFYHPEAVRQLSAFARFDSAEVFPYPGRVAFARLTKKALGERAYQSKVSALA